MALLTANGAPVDEAHVAMPRQGAWVADVVIDADGGFDPGTRVTISAADGLELVGTVAPSRGGEFIGSIHARVIAGAAGLPTLATPADYVGAKLSDIVQGLLADAGEALSEQSDAAMLAGIVDRWHVIRQPVSTALGTLLKFVAPTAVWRVLPNGKVWIGAETWPDASVEYEVMALRPAEHAADLGVETISITPGVNLPGLGRVDQVEHAVGADKVRTVVTLDDGTERGKGAILALARAAFPTIGYLRWCRGKVVKQSGQRVDVDCDDPDIGSLSDVPIRHGLPGVEVTITPQAFVRVCFEDNNPGKPFVALWDGGETVQSISLAGSSYSALRTEDFLTDLATALGTIVSANGGGNVLSDGGVKMAAFLLKFDSYKSLVLKHG